MLLYVHTVEDILVVNLRTFLYILKYQCVTLNQKKLKWFQDKQEFLRMDMESGVTQPVHSKNEAFSKIEIPNK